MANAATQQVIEIDKIKEGVIILRNKALRGVLMVSSSNFALKSEEEQNAITFQFQNFLNSLDFSIEMVVQSKKLNITGYLEKLKELEAKQKNELLKIQITEYQKFIREMIRGSAIMSKQFFVIVPFSLIELPRLTAEEKKQKTSSLTEEKFQRAKNQLWQRLEFVALGLRRCGLQSVPLNTSELIELFWSLYHPEEAEVGYYPDIPPELTM
ncbi:MAG: hypothetical protein KJI70_02865 [Patescibacteria group bacterium]|nr:hypothetical protein [Patescibacteria group bacterium]